VQSALGPDEPRRERSFLGRLVGLAIVLALPCVSCSRLSLPEGDELASLEAVYENPQGRVTRGDMERAATMAVDRLDAILGLGRLDFVVDSLTDVAEVVKDVASDEGTGRFRVTAVTTVDKICPGAGEEVDPDNGHLTYTLRVRENGVLDTVWGDFNRCQFIDPGEVFAHGGTVPRTPGSLVTFDGSMDVYLGGNLRLRELEFEHFLFRVDGVLDLPDAEIVADFDFRVDREQHTQVRVPVSNGDVVFSFVPSRMAVGLATRDGLHCCDFDRRFCVSSDSAACNDLEEGDRVIEW